jgi:hypothetical protein
LRLFWAFCLGLLFWAFGFGFGFGFDLGFFHFGLWLWAFWCGKLLEGKRITEGKELLKGNC